MGDMGNKVRYTKLAHRTALSCRTAFDEADRDLVWTRAEVQRLRRKLELLERQTAIADTALAVGDMLMKGVETRTYVTKVIGIYQSAVDELPALGETA